LYVFYLRKMEKNIKSLMYFNILMKVIIANKLNLVRLCP
jgi:hypothetical protein